MPSKAGAPPLVRAERSDERDDAERAWLAGEDIFADVRRDPSDLFLNGRAGLMYEHAFR
jgi:hypothetical protein